jgi:paraquat-inducible protein A
MTANVSHRGLLASAGGDCIACADCGLTQRLPPLVSGRVAECLRCHKVFARPAAGSLDGALALLLAALLAWIPASIADLMVVGANGAVRSGGLANGVMALWDIGFPFLATLVALFSIVVPWVFLALLAYVLASVRLHAPSVRARGPSPVAVLFRWARHLRPWVMMEVYLIGACVAYSRLDQVAHVTIGPAGWSLAAAAVLTLLALAELDERTVWEAFPCAPGVERRETGAPSRSIACLVCDLLAHDVREGDRCLRCGAVLEARKHRSVQRTAALVLAGFLLYIPANLLPVLAVERYGRDEPNTILGGVVELAHIGLWPLAAIVFGASIVIPLVKLSALSWNLFLTSRGSPHLLVARTRLHRWVDVIGRWSNIDVFVISLLVALVQFGTLERVRPQSGVVAFAAVVVVTMIAARSFDTRLMWDAGREG